MPIQRGSFRRITGCPEETRTIYLIGLYLQRGAKIKRLTESYSLAVAEHLIRDRYIISAAEYNTERHLIQGLSYLWDGTGR